MTGPNDYLARIRPLAIVGVEPCLWGLTVEAAATGAVIEVARGVRKIWLVPAAFEVAGWNLTGTRWNEQTDGTYTTSVERII